MKLRFLSTALSFLTLLVSNTAYAAGTDPIYGINFYGTGAENTIKNGKQMWTLEMIYTTE